jgi:hypothetical protein
MRVQLPFTLLACVLIASVAAAPAHAQRARTFVASTGVDNGTCSFSQPCRTFQGAFGVTAVGGEITAIDTAGYGSLSITHSVTITNPPGIEAGIAPASGQDAVSITSNAGDVVVLRGLTLEGGGGLNGRNGISFSGTGGFSAVVSTLDILDCVIKDFQDGVLVASTNGGTAQVHIKNTTVVNSSNVGIHIRPQGSGSNAVATLESVSTPLNAWGIYFDTGFTSGTISASIANSNASNNTNGGIVLNAPTQVNTNSIKAYITNTTIVESGVANGAAVNDLAVNGYAAAVLSGNKIGALGGNTNMSTHIETDGTNLIANNHLTLSNIGQQ